jgi:ketosteroid isomerase-like protein
VTSPAADASENLVREVVALISAGRYDDMLGLLHDDLVFELPYGPAGFPPSFDKKTFDAMQRATFSLFSSFSLEIVDVHHLRDADGLIAEYRSDSVVKASGKPYRNRYIGVFHFRDGKIAGWREYHNPEIANAALNPG